MPKPKQPKRDFNVEYPVLDFNVSQRVPFLLLGSVPAAQVVDGGDGDGGAAEEEKQNVEPLARQGARVASKRRRTMRARYIDLRL